jgi:hypothetical protein
MNQYNASGYVNPEITYNGEITSPNDIVVNVLNNTISIGGSTFEYEANEGTAIEDANGTLWIVDINGNVILTGQTGVTFIPPPPTDLNTTNGKATFSAHNTQLYGYDHQFVQPWTNYYLQVHDIKDDSWQTVDWKSVQSGKYDIISVQFSNLNGVVADSIFLYCPSGTIYRSQGTGLNRYFYVVGGDANDRQDIYAAYKTSGGEIINIGKLAVTSFEEQTQQICLVPFAKNMGTAPTVSAQQIIQIQHALDSIYKGAVIKYQVSISPSPLIESAWDLNSDNKIEINGEGMATYCPEMNSAIAALKLQPWFQAGNKYLFITNIPPDSTIPGIQGSMPRKKDFGFIFSNPSSPQFLITVAHEIGHGIFSLEHSFEGVAPAPKSSTNNLLDYSSGSELVHWQWYWMHNPTGWPVFDNGADDDRVFVDIRELLPFINADSTTFTFLTPAGKPLTIPKAGLERVVFSYGDDYKSCDVGVPHNAPIGALSSFKLNGINYLGTADCGSSQFICYSNSTQTEIYIDSLSANVNPSSAIVGHPCVSAGTIIFVVTKSTVGANNEYGTNYRGSGTFKDHLLVWDGFSLQANETQIAADIKPPYSSDATAYLNDNLDAAGCGEIGISYVLTYAYQINRYPNTYECCIKYETPSTPNPNSPNAIYLPAPQAYNSIPPTTPYEQKEQQLKQLAIDTRTNFAAIEQKRKTINQELLSENNHASLAGVLLSIPPYACIWNSIHANTRLHCITVLTQSTVEGDWAGLGNNYEQLTNDLLKTAQDVNQQDTLLNAFAENDCALIKSLWDVLDLNGLDEFINTITGWVVQRDPNRPSFSTLSSQVLMGYDPNNPFRYFEFYTWSEQNSSGETFTFTTGAPWQGGNIHLWTTYDPVRNDQQPGSHTEITLGVYDWIAVKMMKDAPSLGLKEGQCLVVPMIWAKWLSHRTETNDASHKLEIIAQIVLFLATDFVGNALFEGAFVAANPSVTLMPRIVGQDLRAVITTQTKTAEITLEMELEGAIYTWKGVKWEPVYNPAATVVGRVNNCKFLTAEGQIVEREMLVVETAETICVRDATAVATSGSFVEGESIAGKVILKVRNGSNGKIAVIGRKMAGHVETVGASLKSSGFEVELFNAEYQSGNIFNIGGRDYTWAEIETDFRNLNNQYSVDVNGWITNEELPNTLMYKANEIWANKVRNQGYTIIDMGVPPGVSTPSVFYQMEQTTIFAQ